MLGLNLIATLTRGLRVCMSGALGPDEKACVCVCVQQVFVSLEGISVRVT